MFSHFINGSKSTVDTFSSGLNWILRNKVSIAIFALLATTDSVAAKNTIFHFECGSFEMKKSDEAISSLSVFSKPAALSAVFDDEAFERDCFVPSDNLFEQNNIVICHPPEAFQDLDYLQITTENDSVCDSFNQLAKEKRINAAKFLTKGSQNEAKLNVNSILVETAFTPEGFTPATMDALAAGRNIIFHLECGSFEMKKSEEAVSALSMFTKPARFSAVFNNENFERECIVTSNKLLEENNIVFCSPPKTFKDVDYMQITRESNDVCDDFNQLVKKKRVKPSKFFTERSQKRANFNMYSVLAEEVTAEGYAPSSFQAKRK